MSNPFQDAYSSLTGAAPGTGAPSVNTGAPSTNPFQNAYGQIAGATTATNPFQAAYGAAPLTPSQISQAAAQNKLNPQVKSSSPNLFHQLVNTAGATAGAIGSLVGEAAKEAAGYAVGGSEQITNNLSSLLPGDNTTHFGNPAEQAGGSVFGTQKEWTQNLNANPVAGGILRGYKQTGEEVAHPTQIAKNYSANPLMAALNDIGTISTILPAVGETIHGAAVGATPAEGLAAATKAGEVSTAAARAARVGDIVTKIGEFPTIGSLIGSSRGALAAIADRLAQDPELLHAVDVAATGAPQNVIAGAIGKIGPSNVVDAATKRMAQTLQDALDAGQVPENQIARARSILADVSAFTQAASSAGIETGATSADVMAQQAARDAAQQAVQVQKGTLTGALAKTGAGLKDTTQRAINTITDMETRLKNADLAFKATKEGAFSIPMQEGSTIEVPAGNIKQLAQAKEMLTSSALSRLAQSPVVERINEADLASLTASAKEVGKSITDYVKSIGFTNLQEATNGRLSGELARTSFVPNSVAAQLDKYTAQISEPGVAGNLLSKGTKLTQMMKMAISPTTVLNRIGHAGLIAADNPNTVDSLKLMGKTLTGRLSESELEDLQRTTMVQHGAVWEASAKAEATETGRVRAIADNLTNLPSNILQKSPFLRAARLLDDAARSGIWLAARQAGASPEDADLILGRTAGYFDRSTVAGRNISKAIPFYNWNKQVLSVLTNMAESHPGAFSEFTLAAANMSKYNTVTGNTTGETQIGNHNVNLGFLSPFSNVASSLNPSELLSAPLKAGFPILTGTNPSGYSPSSPTGPVQGRGLHQLPAAGHNLANSLPQLGAVSGLISGNAGEARYGTGQLKALPGKEDALQAWAAMLGITESPVSAANAQAAAQAKSAATSAKIQASEKKSYQRKLAAVGK